MQLLASVASGKCWWINGCNGGEEYKHPRRSPSLPLSLIPISSLLPLPSFVPLHPLSPTRLSLHQKVLWFSPPKHTLGGGCKGKARGRGGRERGDGLRRRFFNGLAIIILHDLRRQECGYFYGRNTSINNRGVRVLTVKARNKLMTCLLDYRKIRKLRIQVS